MTKQKVGLVLFWVAAIWAILWGVIVSYPINSATNALTMDELNQTMWAMTGPLFLIWGVFGATLAALVAGIGLLLYSGAKGSTVWKFGIGIVLAFVIAMAISLMGYFPPLFGIGGSLILLLFFGILWLWAKERIALKGSSTAAADFRLAGYVSMLMAAWWV
jgi:hypothetical protein